LFMHVGHSQDIPIGRASTPVPLGTSLKYLDIRLGHSTRTFDLDIRLGHSTWTFDLDIRLGHLTWTFDLDIRLGHSTWTRMLTEAFPDGGLGPWTFAIDQVLLLFPFLGGSFFPSFRLGH